jgi:ATP-dependent protease Clp ATPase subunit
MAEVIPFKKEEPKCSFCGVSKSKAKGLWTGFAGKHICDKCVAHCKELIKEYPSCLIPSPS